ncbi:MULTISPECIES: extracellular solute-binding protein [Saccharibacillus]|uniref:extracellular solute-binding protein n=1 Tax=Saccharibacillus TaxID=456492 RepID=UPI00123A9E9C|nr:extracellular solute-binding protein [Saccharibacillus sp. WB 17]MWJ30525.1 extracellular solute-binding protein [Saccharibacillus sp. WB 17]
MRSGKKIPLAMSSVVLLAILASCSDGGDKADTSTSATELEAWVSNEKVTSDAYLFSEIEKEFGVNINVKMRGVGAQDYVDKLNVQISSGEIPDWINDYAVNVGLFDKYVEQGILAEVPVEMIKANMPNYMAWVDKYKEIFKGDPFALFERNGKNYTIPTANPDLTKFLVMYYRQDWLDAVGIKKTPESLAEMEEALVKFRNDDPDGNGQKDTYGYLGIQKDPMWAFSPIYGAYGMYPGLWTEKEGRIARDEIDPKMKEVLTLLNDWYNKDLIDPEWVALDFDQARNKIISSKVGATWQNINAGQEGTGWYAPIKDVAPKASWALSPGPTGPNGDHGIMHFNPIAGMGIMFGKQLEKNPEKMKKYLQIFDKVNNDITWLEKRSYGEEGKTFKKENGGYTWLPPYDKADERQKLGLGEARFPTLEPPFLDVDKENELLPTAKDREYKIKAQTIATGKYDLLTPFSKPEYDKVSTKLTDLTTKAYTDFITGKRPISEFDAYVAEWKKLGGDQAMEEAQQIYDKVYK